jgi:phosphoglycolate phosphatase-like HAD superfamily hydrolase
MSERWIFLDLDGTLLDVSLRYHRLHQDVVGRFGGRPLQRDVYWDAKRNRIPEEEMFLRAGLSAAAVPAALAERQADLENPKYLALDFTWPWLADPLIELESWGKLALVTLRHHKDRLERQVWELGLSLFLERVISGPGDGTPEAKAALLRDSGICWSLDSVLVGDTEVDVASGRALGLRTVAVSSGIRVPALLASWSPDVLLEDLRQAPAWLAGRRSQSS